MWLHYAALPAGGLLMLIRYLVRLFRYMFHFDPVTMTVGHIPAHELPGGIAVPTDCTARAKYLDRPGLMSVSREVTSVSVLTGCCEAQAVSAFCSSVG